MGQLMRQRELALVGCHASVEKDESSSFAGEQASAQTPVRVRLDRCSAVAHEPGIEGGD